MADATLQREPEELDVMLRHTANLNAIVVK
jgi:hypothetical protein